MAGCVKRLLQGPQATLQPLIPLLCQKEVDGLAGLGRRTIQIAPVPTYADVGFIYTPPHPHRSLAAMERGFELDNRGRSYPKKPTSEYLRHIQRKRQ
jgi:hypothetical protein